ncbi:MAG: rod shape-determining protein MreC [Solirubrobacterales bacterium]|nr:rod shape-determining protein MreC [Solirubrobacterales bacterium]HRV60024.1 rod shape-determining protein MreC [Solirubrobacterales bacterium]
MYRKQVRRRRAVLIGLIVLGFVLLTFTFGSGSGGLGGAVGTVFDPITNGASRALKPARDLVNWFDETMNARGERDRLQRDLEEARGQAVAGQVAMEENRQLRQLVGLKKAGKIPDAYSPVTVNVTGRSPTVWYTTVNVNAGSSDGVAVNDPVISGDGLVGRISSVSRSGSVVSLISDSNSAVSAMILPGGAQGVIRAKVGDPRTLVLEFLDETKNVTSGQTVVTSGWRGDGLSSLYPRGLPVGEITRAPIDEREAIQSVELRPFADLRNLDTLQILTGGNRG